MWGERAEILIRQRFFVKAKTDKEKGENNMYTFAPVKFNSEEERLAAKRRMVGMRKEFEARVREIMAKQSEMQVTL